MRTAADIFCGGAGGWALGLHWAGVRVCMGCEIDPGRAAAYSARWGAPVHDDVETLTAEMILDANGGHRPWLLCGSPPCQDGSEINQTGKGVDGDRTKLFLDVARLAGELRTPRIAFENVPGLRTRGVDRVLQLLEDGGYACWPLVVGARHAGLAHQRERLWLLGALATGEQGRPAGCTWPPLVGAPAGWRMEPRPEIGGPRVEHYGAAALGRHLRAYDGVSGGVADRAKSAFGDAVTPLITRAIARSFIAAEERYAA